MVDVRNALIARARAAGDLVLRPIRRGNRTVLWAPPQGLGFGNFLYLWLHAYVSQSGGADYRVLTPPSMDPWLAVLPRLGDELCLARAEVGLTDRREWSWFSRLGDDFRRDELHAFVQDMIIGSPLLEGSAPDPTTVVVNVRRGDYYSAPHFRGTYSFDIPAYVDIALRRMASTSPVPQVLVVSDGLDWCRLKLDALLHQYAASVEYVAATDSPQDNFRVVASAARLIGTNSTFSYWGGYVSNVLHGPASHVVMPRFHARLGVDHGATQLDPTWDVVEDIPGGWDA